MPIAAVAAAIVLGWGLASAQPVPLPPSAAAPQYFPIELPSGANLISTPLNAGEALARDVFLGMPPDWPFFYTWDSDTQSFVDANALPMKPGSGYWAFMPAPTTLVSWGEPDTSTTALIRHLEPGWHLVGIPFTEGVKWNSFRLYTSGNPVDLETARQLGWITARPMTMWGSQYYYQNPGDTFEPGFAYWVHTTTPLDVRVDRPAPVATGTPTGTASASSATGWISAIGDALKDMTSGAFDMAEGKWLSGGTSFLSGAFGLLEYAFGTTQPDPVIAELDQMDYKLDILITEVGAISAQLGQVEAQLTGIVGFMKGEAKLGQPMLSAETWLATYYLDTSTTAVSREWARWMLAGCDPSKQTQCPSSSNPVTTANYNNFVAAYMQNKGGTSKATDDFPLWWSYSVIGNQVGGVVPYLADGNSALALVNKIKSGLVDYQGTSDNGLYAYMQYIYSTSACTTNVAHPNCDLYTQVYLPVEAYFSQAIGYQAQLVEAVTESYGVLGLKDPAAYGNAAANYMIGADQTFNQEIESFLRVAEAIALYRAADGRWDWSTFPSTDAGQLLARADFIASRLGVANSTDHPVTGYVNPPWPKSGVVGRVIYVKDQAVSTTRGVCTGTGQAYCTSTSAQLSELASSKRTVTGDWQYIQWTAVGTSASGIPTAQWTIQRLSPATLADGVYRVNSSDSGRGSAQLTVAEYDSDYTTPPVDTSQPSISFGSFNSVEGWIGRHGLRNGAATWTTSGCTDNKTHDYTYAFDAAHYTVNIAYLPGAGTINSQQGNCQQTATLSVDTSTIAGTYKSMHLHWPGSVNVAVNAKVDHTWGGAPGWYYAHIGFRQQLLDANGKIVGNITSADNNPCSATGDGFDRCTYSNSDMSLNTGAFQLTSKASYTLKSYLYSMVTPYEIYGPGYGYQREAIAGSAVQWVTSYPVFTLTKD